MSSGYSTFFLDQCRMIYEPDPSFSFAKLSFISPTSSSGGYFIRCLMEKTPFYIQPPRCTSRGGILKSGKKMYCDLLFHEDESFTEFLYAFETYCQNVLFENREKWFDSQLDLAEIENCFAASLKIIKSGKHSLRVGVPALLGKCELTIYNEDEQQMLPEDIVDKTLMTILELKGIRCSAKSFQLEIEMKQMMILRPIRLFESFAFKRDKREQKEPKEEKERKEEEQKEEEPKQKEEKEEEEEEEEEQKQKEQKQKQEEEKEEEEKEKEEEEKKDKFEEIEIELPSETETVTLKKRDEIYFTMYADAKRKAKVAYDFAIGAYLEAKRIKNTYMLDDSKPELEKLEKEECDLIELFSQ